MNYLLDTNVVIDFLKGTLPHDSIKKIKSIIDENSNISIITKIEVLGFNFTSKSEEQITETFVNNSKLIEINNEIVNITINIRKNKKIKLPDAIIAATALSFNYTLITNNVKDFANINDLKLFNPHNS